MVIEIQAGTCVRSLGSLDGWNNEIFLRGYEIEKEIHKKSRLLSGRGNSVPVEINIIKKKV